MEALGLSLIKNHLQNRLEIQNFLKELRSITSRALGTEMAHEEQPRQKGPAVRRRCNLCPSTKDSKHSTICSGCHRTVCKTHSTQVIYTS